MSLVRVQEWWQTLAVRARCTYGSQYPTNIEKSIGLCLYNESKAVAFQYSRCCCRSIWLIGFFITIHCASSHVQSHSRAVIIFFKCPMKLIYLNAEGGTPRVQTCLAWLVCPSGTEYAAPKKSLLQRNHPSVASYALDLLSAAGYAPESKKGICRNK